MSARTPSPHSTIGTQITAAVFGFVVLGCAFGGAVLAFRGFPEKLIPDFVPWFGVVVMIACVFVAGKLFEGVSPAFARWVPGLFSAGVAGVGIHASMVAPGFSLLKGNVALLPGPLSPDALFFEYPLIAFILACIFMAQAGAAISGKPRAYSDRWIPMLAGIGIPATGMLLGDLIAGMPNFTGLSSGPAEMCVIGVILLVVMVWERSWVALDPWLAVSGAVVPIGVSIFLLQLDTRAGMLMALCTLILCLAFFGYSLRRFIAARWLGKVTLKIETKEAHIGKPFVVVISFKPRRETHLVRALCELVCYEVESAKPGSGEESTHTEVDRLRLSGGYADTLVPGKLYQFSLSTVIPDDSEPSSSGSVGYYWELETQVILHGVPDWDDTQTIHVAP